MINEFPTEICFACSKPKFDFYGNFVYVKTETNGFVISHYENGVAIPKLKNGNKIPKTHSVTCNKNDKGARLLKEAPTHSLRFKIVGNILFVAYAVAINDNNKSIHDTYSRKKGSSITAKRIAAIETNWHETGTVAEELKDINDFLPRIVCDTFEHYLSMALYRLNIHGHTTLLIKGDTRDNSFHQIEFEACDDSCPTCSKAKLINLGVNNK